MDGWLTETESGNNRNKTETNRVNRTHDSLSGETLHLQRLQSTPIEVQFTRRGASLLCSISTRFLNNDNNDNYDDNDYSDHDHKSLMVIPLDVMSLNFQFQ